MKKLDIEKLKTIAPFLVNYENLYQEYIVNKLSLPKIKEKYGLKFHQTIFLLDHFNIPKRNLKESAEISIPQIKEKIKENYGVDNISQLEVIKEKKKQTFLKNYGVDNIFKIDDFYKTIKESYKLKTGKDLDEVRSETNKKYYLDNPTAKQKCIEILKGNPPQEKHRLVARGKLKRYHNNLKKESPLEFEEWKNKISCSQSKFWDSLNDEGKYEKTKHLFCIKKSKIESRVEKVLLENGLIFIPQYFLGGYFYDFFVGNFVIEVNGDYWHANKLFYSETDIIAGKKAKDIWQKDFNKIQEAKNSNLETLVLWEHEINSMSDDDIFKKIINFYFR